MKTTKCVTISLLIILLAVGVVLAQELIIYPAKGQSQEQLDKDKYECYSWAKQQTGFDPMQQPKATEPPPQQQAQKGGVGRGAVRGAGVGLAAGAIAGDAGKGAAIGAASGAIVGGARRRDQQRQQCGCRYFIGKRYTPNSQYDCRAQLGPVQPSLRRCFAICQFNIS